MDQPLQITLKDIPHSDAIEQHIHDEVDKLGQFFDHIVSCHVLVGQDGRHQHQGKLYNVRIRLCVPGREIVVTNNYNEDLYISIRDAFADMRRKLEDYAQKLHGKSKNHPEQMHGEIVRLFDQDNFGFIRAEDGTEYYFNSSNVVSPTFNKLEVGNSVHFIAVMEGESPQAHRVRLKK